MNDRRPIRQRLAEFYTETEIDLWIYRPHPALGGQPPRHVVDVGRAEEVHQLLDQMDAGTFREDHT
jgi:uncharacterized protein (DUF2384 family)